LQADKVFEELRQLEPYHVEGIEVYSTVLWHLQKEIQLSALAQDMTKLDKMCPEVSHANLSPEAHSIRSNPPIHLPILWHRVIVCSYQC
jgi:hypothetical protein